MHLCQGGRIAKGNAAHTHCWNNSLLSLSWCVILSCLFPLNYFLFTLSAVFHLAPLHCLFLLFTFPFCPTLTTLLAIVSSFILYISYRAFLAVYCTSGSLSPPPLLSWEIKTPPPFTPVFRLPSTFHGHRLATAPLSLLPLHMLLCICVYKQQ